MTEQPDDLSDQLSDLSGILLGEESLDVTLQRVVELARRAISGCDSAGVTLMRDGKAETSAATDETMLQVDVAQYRTNEGPCLTAINEAARIDAPFLETDPRWPAFAKDAVALGVRSVLSWPLIVQGTAIGALNLYSRSESGFTERDHEISGMFASQAAVALHNARLYDASQRLVRQLEEALESRAVIEQAKGILIERLGHDPDRAFEALRATSQRLNRKVRDIARELVEKRAGRGPDGPR